MVFAPVEIERTNVEVMALKQVVIIAVIEPCLAQPGIRYRRL